MDISYAKYHKIRNVHESFLDFSWTFLILFRGFGNELGQNPYNQKTEICQNYVTDAQRILTTGTAVKIPSGVIGFKLRATVS